MKPLIAGRATAKEST